MIPVPESICALPSVSSVILKDNWYYGLPFWFYVLTFFLIMWLLKNINELLMQCVHWLKMKCACYSGSLHKVFIVLFLKILFGNLLKKSESFGTIHLVIDRSLLLHLWLKKLKLFYFSYKYKHINLQLFVFKLCFCWSSILCLETRLCELQNKWSPNSSDSFFFIVDLALVPGVWFEVTVAAKSFPFHQSLFLGQLNQ